MRSGLFPSPRYNITCESLEVFKKNQLETKALAPKFTVRLAHSTLLKDLETFEASLKRTPVPGVTYTLEGISDITISISPGSNIEEADKKFRAAVSIHTRFLLTSRDSDEIIKQYIAHIKKYEKELVLTRSRSMLMVPIMNHLAMILFNQGLDFAMALCPWQATG